MFVYTQSGVSVCLNMRCTVICRLQYFECRVTSKQEEGGVTATADLLSPQYAIIFVYITLVLIHEFKKKT